MRNKESNGVGISTPLASMKNNQALSLESWCQNTWTGRQEGRLHCDIESYLYVAWAVLGHVYPPGTGIQDKAGAHWMGPNAPEVPRAFLVLRCSWLPSFLAISSGPFHCSPTRQIPSQFLFWICQCVKVSRFCSLNIFYILNFASKNGNYQLSLRPMSGSLWSLWLFQLLLPQHLIWTFQMSAKLSRHLTTGQKCLPCLVAEH